MVEVTHKCTDCTNRKETVIFILCMSPTARYIVGDKEDQHTCTHMRSRGGCGEAGNLFSPKELAA